MAIFNSYVKLPEGRLHVPLLFHLFLQKNVHVSWIFPDVSHVFFEVFWLVVEPYPSEKYEFVSWDDDIPD